MGLPSRSSPSRRERPLSLLCTPSSSTGPSLSSLSPISRSCRAARRTSVSSPPCARRPQQPRAAPRSTVRGCCKDQLPSFPRPPTSHDLLLPITPSSPLAAHLPPPTMQPMARPCHPGPTQVHKTTHNPHPTTHTPHRHRLRGGRAANQRGPYARALLADRDRQRARAAGGRGLCVHARVCVWACACERVRGGLVRAIRLPLSPSLRPSIPPSPPTPPPRWTCTGPTSSPRACSGASCSGPSRCTQTGCRRCAGAGVREPCAGGGMCSGVAWPGTASCVYGVAWHGVLCVWCGLCGVMPLSLQHPP